MRMSKYGNYFCSFTCNLWTVFSSKMKMNIESDFYKELLQKSTETNFYGPSDEMLKNVVVYCSDWKLISIIYRRQRKGWGDSRYLKERVHWCFIHLELSFRSCS